MNAHEAALYLTLVGRKTLNNSKNKPFIFSQTGIQTFMSFEEFPEFIVYGEIKCIPQTLTQLLYHPNKSLFMTH